MIYLDNAATTFPKPLCVGDEVLRCIQEYCGNPGRGSHLLSIISAEKIYEARALLSEMFTAEPENVAFTLNTTYALNIAIKSYLKKGSHVLISDIEHNSVFRPVYELSKQGYCTYDIFSSSGNEEEIINSIKSKLRKNTSMLICTVSSNICSRALPIKRIGMFCKKRNLFFIVDGAQGAGIYDIDVKDMNINALCMPAHKGLYGPQGIGIIILNTDIFGKSIIEGGTGINSLEPNMPDFMPERYEAGTLPTPSIAGLCESLKWLKTISINKIRSHEESLYCILSNLLSENEEIKVYNDGNMPGSILLFNIKGVSSATVGDELNKLGFCVRSGLHCSPLGHKTITGSLDGAIRVSFGIFNSPKDVYELNDALAYIIKNKK